MSLQSRSLILLVAALAAVSEHRVRAAPEVSERLAAYRLGPNEPVDGPLQRALEQLEACIAEELGITKERRACGVLDLTELRLALVRPDALFYGASVPKICIVLGYFATRPERATWIAPDVRRELELVVKRSSNELAAKYSQIVGLETLQRLQRSGRYRLYDEGHGGGLWCGKHYGLDEPRTGDPVGDYSHAATVRQCLRYYLMMEQGRLVSPAASRRIAEIFAAPELEFHDTSFVAGLRGRDLTLIRKSGLWEDWHLDTARVEHGDRVYLLAGMTRHERGREYLARLAAAVDDELCGPSAPKPLRHELHRFERAVTVPLGTAAEGRESRSHAGEYTGPPITAGHPFNEALLSWNVRTPVNHAMTVELRVDRDVDGSWSPWLFVGGDGVAPESVEKLTRFDEGRIDVDYFRSTVRFRRAQYRLRFYRANGKGTPEQPEAMARIARVALCFSDTSGIPDSVRTTPTATGRDEPVPRGSWERRLPVPFRSQRTEAASLAGRICSPTSLAMVMEYRGARRSTLEVARRAYDAAHDIYGNWPRAVQAAYSFGVPGYLTRFSDWRDVERTIATGQPLIISIRAKAGQLTGAPYSATNGHLLVVTGFDARGDVLVNDPAASTPAAGRLTYRRSELETVWMRRGGTSYILLPANE